MLLRRRPAVMRLATRTDQARSARLERKQPTPRLLRRRPPPRPGEADDVVRPAGEYHVARAGESRPGVADELLRLTELFEAGVLSVAEFSAAKARVLEG